MTVYILQLIVQGADVNVLDGEQHTPIHVAALTGHSAILTFLTQSRFSPRLDQLTIYPNAKLHAAVQFDGRW